MWSTHSFGANGVTGFYTSLKARCIVAPASGYTQITNEIWTFPSSGTPGWTEMGQLLNNTYSGNYRDWFFAKQQSSDPNTFYMYVDIYNHWNNQTNYSGIYVKWTGGTFYQFWEGGYQEGGTSTGPIGPTGSVEVGDEIAWQTNEQDSFYNTNGGFYDRNGNNFLGFYSVDGSNAVGPFVSNSQVGNAWVADYVGSQPGAGGC